MFGSCFTPKPAHTGAPMAQLRVVDNTQYKPVEDFLKKEEDAGHKTTAHSTRKGRSGQSMVRKLLESSEKR